ncbi:receptor expression-enhancing protein 5 isoform X1 [Coccinella septempunctata]|uniref:receptor expression-enhancing protein 5 isoform X1 n=1 Tax=Coccinella septempunctata TaxID=41139 RepID=UPI001D05CE52|nr:receptor expression-enhancing protein 5 isoform X1 [Coccinella septempunctata]
MAGKILAIKEQVNASLHDTNKPWTKCFEEAEKKSGVDRLYIFVGLIGIVGAWLVFGFAAQLVCNFVGFIYPAYASMKALESKNKDDDTKWLTYWVVFACFSVVEFFSDFIVGWFPLYWLIKCSLFIWLMAPGSFNGSNFIYSKFIRSHFLKHQNSVDEAIDKLIHAGAEGLSKLEKKGD